MSIEPSPRKKKVNVTFFGHNCYMLEGDDVALLTDPWLSDKGAFFGSWFQWPINHHYITQLINQLKENRRTYLYVSHEHQDHFDKETLLVIKDHITACIIPKYHDSSFKDDLIAIGYEVIELEDQTIYFFSEHDYIELMIVDVGVNHDSAAIVHIDNETFFNQNDCKISDRLACLENRHVDYYTMQFSGATAYPVCFELGPVYIQH